MHLKFMYSLPQIHVYTLKKEKIEVLFCGIITSFLKGKELCSNMSAFLHEVSIINRQQGFAILLVGRLKCLEFAQVYNHSMFGSISVSPSLPSAAHVDTFPALLQLCAVT